MPPPYLSLFISTRLCWLLFISLSYSRILHSTYPKPPPLPLLPFTIYWVLSISISRIEIPVQFCASLINLKHWYELICVLDTVFVVIFYFYVLGLFNLSWFLCSLVFALMCLLVDCFRYFEFWAVNAVAKFWFFSPLHLCCCNWDEGFWGFEVF